MISREGDSVIHTKSARRLICLFLSLCVLCLLPLSTSAWNSNGHRIVARIAFDRLSPSARKEVAKLLAGESFENASTWADKMKASRPNTAAWHYINWKLQRNNYDRKRDCGQECIIEAINKNLDEFRNSNLPAQDRAEALKFLIHLVGDLHQPYHVSTNGFPEDNWALKVRVVLPDGRPSNLNAVWDDEIINFSLAQSRAPVSDYAAQLSSRYSSGAFTQSQSTNISTQGSVADWGLEAHWLCWEAYKLPNGWFMVDQKPDDTRKFMIDKAYLEKNRPIVERQLVRAGARLARILNETFASKSAF
jgi:nuclease S1